MGIMKFSNTYMAYITNGPNQFNNQLTPVQKTGYHYIPTNILGYWLKKNQLLKCVMGNKAFRVVKACVEIENMIPITETLAIQGNSGGR